MNPLHFYLKLCAISLLSLTLVACNAPKEVKENEAITQQIINTPRLIQNHILYMKGPTGDFKLHYVNSDPSTNARNTVVFIHGTPGDWSTFARFFQQVPLRHDFRLVSLDRPGWGKSTYAGNYPADLQSQSDMIGPMLKDIWQHNGKQKLILVGHSQGGSLVPILAADYPNYVRAVVILAGDLESDLTKTHWYNRLLDSLPGFFIPDMWYHSNKEVVNLASSLDAAQSKLARLQIPVSILQGTNDTQVNPLNTVHANIVFPLCSLQIEWIEGAGHLINLQHVDDVIKLIYSINDRSTLLL